MFTVGDAHPVSQKLPAQGACVQAPKAPPRSCLLGIVVKIVFGLMVASTVIFGIVCCYSPRAWSSNTTGVSRRLSTFRGGSSGVGSRGFSKAPCSKGASVAAVPSSATSFFSRRAVRIVAVLVAAAVIVAAAVLVYVYVINRPAAAVDQESAKSKADDTPTRTPNGPNLGMIIGITFSLLFVMAAAGVIYDRTLSKGLKATKFNTGNPGGIPHGPGELAPNPSMLLDNSALQGNKPSAPGSPAIASGDKPSDKKSEKTPGPSDNKPSTPSGSKAPEKDDKTPKSPGNNLVLSDNKSPKPLDNKTSKNGVASKYLDHISYDSSSDDSDDSDSDDSDDSDSDDSGAPSTNSPSVPDQPAKNPIIAELKAPTQPDNTSIIDELEGSISDLLPLLEKGNATSRRCAEHTKTGINNYLLMSVDKRIAALRETLKVCEQVLAQGKMNWNREEAEEMYWRLANKYSKNKDVSNHDNDDLVNILYLIDQTDKSDNLTPSEKSDVYRRVFDLCRWALHKTGNLSGHLLNSRDSFQNDAVVMKLYDAQEGIWDKGRLPDGTRIFIEPYLFNRMLACVIGQSTPNEVTEMGRLVKLLLDSIPSQTA